LPELQAHAEFSRGQSMIPKWGCRFSEKIILRQETTAG
jgi:hypothetical protein